jgi:hypothetical protein
MNLEEQNLNEAESPQLHKHSVSTRLFNIEYYNEKGTILKETQIRGKNKDDAQVHFKFFYPKKYIWKITAI